MTVQEGKEKEDSAGDAGKIYEDETGNNALTMEQRRRITGIILLESINFINTDLIISYIYLILHTPSLFDYRS